MAWIMMNGWARWFITWMSAAVPEAAGLAAIMPGARAQAPDDDALLQAMSTVLDSLHAAYGEAGQRGFSGSPSVRSDEEAY